MGYLSINVKELPFDAKGDGKSDDTKAIQAAINAARKLSASKKLAITVLIPPGDYLIMDSLMLPASGSKRETVVHLEGYSGGSRIRGDKSFPEGKGLIEWERSLNIDIDECEQDLNPDWREKEPARALAQRITGLEFSLPEVEGTKAIYRRWEGLLYPKTAQQQLSNGEQDKSQAIAKLKDDYENSASIYSDWNPGILPSLESLEEERFRKDQEQVIAKYLENKHPGKTEQDLTEEEKEGMRDKLKQENLEDFDSAFIHKYYDEEERKRAYFEQQRSRLQVHLENLVINGNNKYHESLLRFEGSVINSTIHNIHGNCSRGGKPKYDSILLHFDDGNELISSYPKSFHLYAFDNVGFQYGHIENVEVNLYNGYGFHSIFKGRINRSSLINAHATGGSLETPAFHFLNSFESELINLTTEGIAEKPIYKLENCHGLTLRKIGIGTPTPAESYQDRGGHIIGNGIELYECTDCIFESRTIPNLAYLEFKSRVKSLNAAAARNQRSLTIKSNNPDPSRIYLIKLDEKCKRNVFANFQVYAGTDPIEEFFLGQVAIANNYIYGFNHATQETYEVGIAPRYPSKNPGGW